MFGSWWYIVFNMNYLEVKYNLWMFVVRDIVIFVIVFINIWFLLGKKFEKFSEVFLILRV